MLDRLLPTVEDETRGYYFRHTPQAELCHIAQYVAATGTLWGKWAGGRRRDAVSPGAAALTVRHSTWIALDSEGDGAAMASLPMASLPWCKRICGNASVTAEVRHIMASLMTTDHTP